MLNSRGGGLLCQSGASFSTNATLCSGMGKLRGLRQCSIRICPAQILAGNGYYVFHINGEVFLREIYLFLLLNIYQDSFAAGVNLMLTGFIKSDATTGL